MKYLIVFVSLFIGFLAQAQFSPASYAIRQQKVWDFLESTGNRTRYADEFKSLLSQALDNLNKNSLAVVSDPNFQMQVRNLSERYAQQIHNGEEFHMESIFKDYVDLRVSWISDPQVRAQVQSQLGQLFRINAKFPADYLEILGDSELRIGGIKGSFDL